MSRVTIKKWYERVNALWEPHKPLPELTAPEAIRAARKLYRFQFKRKYSGEITITSGNRYTRIRRVNPEQGWERFIHSLSHRFHAGKPHCGNHARLEMRLIKQVIERGWLSGTLKDKLKPERAAIDPRAVTVQRLNTNLENWRAKQQRAERAIRKLSRRLKYYARATAQAGASATA